jgi:hypothetical protein
MGSDLGFDPVARMMFFASSVLVSPPSSGSSSPWPALFPDTT